ncbi:MAG: hypothetical protein COS68_01805 [Elusimicrobia bacterium CG06_land_8_20_14_3_00_38_11]|nr:MAG: hypothetical protein COS68_01805 [Elusimicrobia bacterium CG06_land_8_20_14_3_00_38_11]
MPRQKLKMEKLKEEEHLKEKYYKRYGIAYSGLLKTKKTFKSLTMSLGEIFLLLRKRKKK